MQQQMMQQSACASIFLDSVGQLLPPITLTTITAAAAARGWMDRRVTRVTPRRMWRLGHRTRVT